MATPAVVTNGTALPSTPLIASHALVASYLVQARTRWLKPHELNAVLVHAKAHQYEWRLPPTNGTSSHDDASATCVVSLLSTAAPRRPPPGSIFLFDRAQVARWRKDHYTWQGTADRHTNLKLNGVDHLSCSYAKCRETASLSTPSEAYLGTTAGTFQRRGYSLLTEPDIVLVHYLDTRTKSDPTLATAALANGVHTSISSSATDSGAVDITQFIHHFLPSADLTALLAAAPRSQRRNHPSAVAAVVVPFNGLSASDSLQPFAAAASSCSAPVLPVPQPQSSLQQLSPPSSKSSSFTVLEYAPAMDIIGSGNKMLICLSSGSNDTSLYCHFRCSAATHALPAATVLLERVAGETHRIALPTLSSPGDYFFCITDSATFDRATHSTPSYPFQFRLTAVPSPSAASMSLPHRSPGQSPSRRVSAHQLARSPRVSIRARLNLDQQRNSLSIPTSASVRSSPLPQQHQHFHSPATSPSQPIDIASHERELTSALIQCLQRIESTFSGRPASTVPSSFSLADLESCALDAPGADLIESLLICMLRKMMANGRDATAPMSAASTHSRPSRALVDAAQLRDTHGRQLIHFVAGLGYTDLLSLLLSHFQANVNSQDAAGRTPLHYATLADPEGDESQSSSSPAAMMVSALLSYGADDSIIDSRGFTPLALADAAGRASIVSVFLEVQNVESMGQDNDEDDEDDADDMTHDANASNMLLLGIPAAGDSADEREDEDADGDTDMLGEIADEGLTVFTSPSAGAMSIPTAVASTSSSSPPVNPSSSFSAFDRAFSSLTLHDMGINAADFTLPTEHGTSGSNGANESSGMSASALFASPTPQFSKIVSAIQRQIRWWLFRRHAAANKLQSVARGMLVRRSLKRMREASLTIQSKFRQRKVRREFVKLQRATRIIQERFRGARNKSPESHAATSLPDGSEPFEFPAFSSPLSPSSHLFVPLAIGALEDTDPMQHLHEIESNWMTTSS